MLQPAESPGQSTFHINVFIPICLTPMSFFSEGKKEELIPCTPVPERHGPWLLPPGSSSSTVPGKLPAEGSSSEKCARTWTGSPGQSRRRCCWTIGGESTLSQTRPQHTYPLLYLTILETLGREHLAGKPTLACPQFPPGPWWGLAEALKFASARSCLSKLSIRPPEAVP